jgi:hypothetical protein
MKITRIQAICGLKLTRLEYNVLMDILDELPGGDALKEWFGGTPSFHDAEVLSIDMRRAGATCELRVHAFEMTGNVDERGRFVRAKDAVVVILLEGLTTLDLTNFNEQNAIFALSLDRAAAGFKLTIEASYGVSGFFEAREIRIKLEPGMPS